MTGPLYTNSQSHLIRIPPVYQALVKMSKELDDQVLFPMTKEHKAREKIKELLEQIKGNDLLEQACLPHNQAEIAELNQLIENGVTEIINGLEGKSQNTFEKIWEASYIKTPKGYDETQQRTSHLLDLRKPPGPAQTIQPNSLSINSRSDLMRIPPVYQALVKMSEELDDQVLFPMTRRSKARQEIKELLERIEGSNLLKQAYLPHNQQQLEDLNTQIEEGVATIISKLKEPAQNTFGEMWQKANIRTSPAYNALVRMSKELDDQILLPGTESRAARNEIKKFLKEVQDSKFLEKVRNPPDQREQTDKIIEGKINDIINKLGGSTQNKFKKMWQEFHIKIGNNETLSQGSNQPGPEHTIHRSPSGHNLTQQSSHSTIEGLNEAVKKKLTAAFGADKSRLLIDLFEGTDPGKAARDIRTALKNEERGTHNGLLDDALDNAVDKTLRNMYDKVFEICKEENLVSYSKGGADKGVIDVAGQTLEYQQNPESKLTRFTIPSEGLSQAVTLRCNKSGAYLTLGPPDGKPIEIVCPKEVEKQCAFDIKHYQEQMSKTSHNTFTAASMDTPNNNLHAPNRGEDKVGATTSFTQHQQEEQPSNGITPTPTPTPTLLNELEGQEKKNARNV